MNKPYQYFSVAGVNALPRFGNDIKVSSTEMVIPFPGPISIYIHIPYCKTICHFCMLRKGSRTVDEIPESFVSTLKAEMELYVDHLKGNTIDAIYFGGGTPSMLAVEQFESILNQIDTLFSLAGDVEITFEGEANSLIRSELLIALKRNKVSRISFGLQTFDQKLRKLLGRTDEMETLYALRERLEGLGFAEINVDYLYNLPGTDVRFLEGELEQLLRFAPTSVDFHPLKYISCSSFMLREIVEKKLLVPTAEIRVEMYRMARAWALKNGYHEQFADQYSKRGGMQSNIYMKHLYGLEGGQYVGFGPGSRSHYGDFGFSNFQSLEEYSKQVETQQLPLAKQVYAPLKDNFITCFPKRNDRLTSEKIDQSTMPGYFYANLEILHRYGYVALDQDAYVLTQTGLDWYQNMQETLLSETQLSKHEQTLNKRKGKLEVFAGYFHQQEKQFH